MRAWLERLKHYRKLLPLVFLILICSSLSLLLFFFQKRQKLLPKAEENPKQIKETRKFDYAPGEIIVKFKPDGFG